MTFTILETQSETALRTPAALHETDRERERERDAHYATDCHEERGYNWSNDMGDIVACCRQRQVKNIRCKRKR
jgi:hypothetical protein